MSSRTELTQVYFIYWILNWKRPYAPLQGHTRRDISIPTRMDLVVPAETFLILTVLHDPSRITASSFETIPLFRPGLIAINKVAPQVLTD